MTAASSPRRRRHCWGARAAADMSPHISPNINAMTHCCCDFLQEGSVWIWFWVEESGVGWQECVLVHLTSFFPAKSSKLTMFKRSEPAPVNTLSIKCYKHLLKQKLLTSSKIRQLAGRPAAHGRTGLRVSSLMTAGPRRPHSRGDGGWFLLKKRTRIWNADVSIQITDAPSTPTPTQNGANALMLSSGVTQGCCGCLHLCSASIQQVRIKSPIFTKIMFTVPFFAALTRIMMKKYISNCTPNSPRMVRCHFGPHTVSKCNTLQSCSCFFLSLPTQYNTHSRVFINISVSQGRSINIHMCGKWAATTEGMAITKRLLSESWKCTSGCDSEGLVNRTDARLSSRGSSIPNRTGILTSCLVFGILSQTQTCCSWRLCDQMLHVLSLNRLQDLFEKDDWQSLMHEWGVSVAQVTHQITITDISKRHLKAAVGWLMQKQSGWRETLTHKSRFIFLELTFTHADEFNLPLRAIKFWYSHYTHTQMQRFYDMWLQL